MADVVFTEPAEQDLVDIEYYIFVNLCNPSASRKVTENILNTIDKMANYPRGYSVVNDNVLSRIGLRMICVNNYNVFYYYDKENERVYIIRILYYRTDWKSILKSE